ncbi:hypothetical protein DPMN_152781 [Dreissena polymorpha]|uniref:Uncharacterized protein n=1 Tax=Dreissena polymorpha TaxID=45954 RepID=A0A9D4J463_DREPO|nr:hypothetical protein DPMN_152781 [Dreissena polymorpha]
MVIVRRWFHYIAERETGAAGVAAWKKGVADIGQRYRPGFRGGCHIKIMKVSQDGGS